MKWYANVILGGDKSHMYVVNTASDDDLGDALDQIGEDVVTKYPHALKDKITITIFKSDLRHGDS